MRKLILLIPLLLSGCSDPSKSEEYPYHTYDEIISFKIEWDDAILINDYDHLVYYYSENCFYCEQLRDEIIDFTLNGYFPIYFVEVNAHVEHSYDYTTINQTIGSNRVEDIYVGVTPQIALISQSKIELNVLDNVYIQEVLDRYKPNI